MGADWWKKEFTKTIDRRNPMCRWATEMCDFERKYAKQEGDLIYLEPNGPMHAYLTLSYDLYVLQDNLKLQEEIIKRLKRIEHFPGARYELLVAATFIRAGFVITHEDESDNSTKHPEFVARHKATGIEFDVEAKKRNRLIKLDFVDFHAGKARLDVRNILAGAINKFRNCPMIVFLDLDTPPLYGSAFTQPWSQELLDVMNDAGNRDEATGLDRVNLIVFTNYPIDYHEKTTPSLTHIDVIALQPVVPIKTDAPFHDLRHAIDLFGRIPTGFGE
jgi:hypothetical protein